MIYDKTINPDIFKGVKLPIIFMEESKVPLPILCQPLGPITGPNSVDVSPESFWGLNNSQIFTTDLNDEVESLLAETQRRHIKHINETQRSLLNYHKKMGKGVFSVNDSELIRLDISSNRSLHDESLEGITKGSLGNLSVDSSNCESSLKGKCIDEKAGILKDYKCSISYASTGNIKRTKRVIHCKYPHCDRTFHKTWNFIDHARMHLGIRPFKCNYCDAKFTQKCNLKKHLLRHLKNPKISFSNKSYKKFPLLHHLGLKRTLKVITHFATPLEKSRGRNKDLFSDKNNQPSPS
ncbi:unnamed protein product [Moneuplotes crassus]|uniref:C2H2-type domain-containing protein n=1 Tax=Euplotes crassus TaxID=5936 RepID=A0AAD1UFI9_EUPCR|nr:unnamed protein product [Moneuplotes crassus]